ncbi:hypothetical protein [Streptomyces niveus]|uniref:ATP-binding protein n=1 Tax=Streptomyces niveus TaxID=193462 RepID=A0A1U9QRN6_STRNV|nr:hypothetical protein [Streptomyces niveus]AQU66850.1 hypothetical protein BBN63_11925 [Streptomyces niveus]
MARHSAPTSRRRALLRAGLTFTAAGAVIGLGGAAAQAAPAAPVPASGPDSELAEAGAAASSGLAGAVGHTLAGGLGPVKSLQLNPLAKTGVDPLDNAVGTQIADFKPLSTAVVTDSITEGGGLQDLPLVGPVTKLLPG